MATGHETKSYSDYSTDELKFLTQGVMTYLDSWELSTEEAVSILGLKKLIKTRHLQGFRIGDRVFPDSSELMIRVDHIIGIADGLRTTYPLSDQMRRIWLTKPHRRFQRETPLSVMLNDDTPNGLLKIRMEVDCNYAYAISEAMRNQSN
ncbi:MAG: hypothetical protein ACI88H_000255 [Cocleimonas sp.]|jgi:hypothetical protein